MSTAVDLDSILAPFSDETPAGEFMNPRDRKCPVSAIEFGLYKPLCLWEDEKLEWLWGRSVGTKSPPAPKKHWAGSSEPIELEWDRVVDECQKQLIERTKDLRLGRMLCVALAFRDGLSGIQDGLKLLIGLLETFGKDVHPQPVENSIKVLWPLAQQLDVAVRLAPLSVEPEQTDLDAFRLKTPDKNVRLVRWRVAGYLTKSSSGLTDEQLSYFKQSAASKTNLMQLLKVAPDYTRQLEEETRQATLLSGRLRQLIDATIEGSPQEKRISREFSSFNIFTESLKECQCLLYATLPTTGSEAGESARGSEPKTNIEVISTSRDRTELQQVAGNMVQQTPPPSREQAITALKDVRNYFVNAEPHSPIPSLLDRAIKWANMPFAEVMAEVLSGHTAAMGALHDRANVVADGSRIEAVLASQERPEATAEPPDATVENEASATPAVDSDPFG